MKELLDKIDKLDDRLDNIDKTLVKQATSLDEHIRRTNLLEEDLKPVKEHVQQVKGVSKFMAMLAVLATIVTVLIQVLR